MAASIYLFVLAVAMMNYLHVTGAAEQLKIPCGIGSQKANPDKWNPDAPNMRDGAEKLRNAVGNCCKDEFEMRGSALDLLMRNVPVDFDKFNAHPRGCVEMDMEVQETRNGKTIHQWRVEINVDNQTKTQKKNETAHYGYTVQRKIPKKPKSTGHVCLPEDVFPPNVRPFIGESKGQIVHFTDDINSGSTRFKLTGKMYNQFRLYAPPPHLSADELR